MSPKKKGSRILYPATKTRMNMSKRTKRRSTGTCDEYKYCLSTKWENYAHCTPSKRGARWREAQRTWVQPRSRDCMIVFMVIFVSSSIILTIFTYIIQTIFASQDHVYCQIVALLSSLWQPKLPQQKKGSFTLKELHQENLWKISRHSDRETVSVEWLSSWCETVKMSTNPSTQAGSGRHCWDTTGSVQRTGLAIHLCNVWRAHLNICCFFSRVRMCTGHAMKMLV